MSGCRWVAHWTIAADTSTPQTSTPQSLRYRATCPGPHPRSQTIPWSRTRSANAWSSCRSKGLRASSATNVSVYCWVTWSELASTVQRCLRIGAISCDCQDQLHPSSNLCRLFHSRHMPHASHDDFLGTNNAAHLHLANTAEVHHIPLP